MLALYFGVLPLKEDIWWNVETQIDPCDDWTDKYANSSCSFPLWTVFMVYLLDLMWDPQLCWCWQAYAHCVTAWMTTCPLSVKRLIAYCQFFIQRFHSINIQFSVHCPETSCTNLRLHNSCWLANILSISVFNGKTHNFLNAKIWRQHDVIISKEYLTFTPMEY